jgi:hypothetical protein
MARLALNMRSFGALGKSVSTALHLREAVGDGLRASLPGILIRLLLHGELRG